MALVSLGVGAGAVGNRTYLMGSLIYSLIIHSLDRGAHLTILLEAQMLLPLVVKQNFPPSVSIGDCGGQDVVTSKHWLWFDARSAGSRADHCFP